MELLRKQAHTNKGQLEKLSVEKLTPHKKYYLI